MVYCASTRFISRQPTPCTRVQGQVRSCEYELCERQNPITPAFVEALFVANAGILGPLATAARMRLQLEAEILRFGVGGLLELEDQIVAVPVGEAGLTDEHVAFLLERDVDLPLLAIGDEGHRLRSGRDGIHRGIIERDRGGVVLLQVELGTRVGLFEQASAFGAAEMFLVGGMANAKANEQSDGGED